MEKQDFTDGIELLDTIGGMLIVLAGNNLVYENAIRDTEIEKKVNRDIFALDNDAVVDTLHKIACYKYVLESGQDWVEHLEKGNRQ